MNKNLLLLKLVLYCHMSKNINLVLIALALGCQSASAIGLLSPDVIYGNLGTVSASTTSNSVGFMSSENQNQFQAQGFSMGSTDFRLTSLQFGLGSIGTANPLVQIYGNNLGAPSSALATFSLTSGPVSSKDIYNFSGSFVAEKNTRYWAVLSNVNSADLESFEWYTNDAFTLPSEKNASGIGYLQTFERNNVGGTWTGAIPVLSIQIRGTAVPEPSTGLLVVLGLSGLLIRRRK